MNKVSEIHLKPSKWVRTTNWVSRVFKSAARTSPARLALVVFTTFIAVVTILLELPISSSNNTRTDLVDALFTAVSAVCVTGLTTVTTAEHWSVFGLIVIMVAMKIGGLGVLTLASLLGLSVMRQMGLAQRIVTARETKTEQLSQVGSILKTIVITSLVFELATFLALIPTLLKRGNSIIESLFNAAFYAISAFNNAGFVPDGTDIYAYYSDPYFAIPIALSVFAGSIGFPVIWVLISKWRTPKRWNLHSQLTILTSLILLALGWIAISISEWNNPQTMADLSFFDKLLNGFFMSTMTRSGGFATLDVSQMGADTWIVMDVLMFIGGGSGSTSGGIKVTTFALLMLAILAEARGDKDVEIFGKRVPEETIRQAISVLVISVAVVFISTWVMLRLTNFSLDQVLFETISAYATAGLSTGITAELPDAAKYCLLLCMYVGRIGPMSLGAALALRSRQRVIRLPKEHPFVG